MREAFANVRSLYRSGVLVSLLAAACVDGWVRKRFFGMKVGAPGAIWVSGWCRRIVRALGVRCSVEGPLPRVGELPGRLGLAVVSNHLSYLDILIYSSIQPFLMVSKFEVRSWPMLGWITAQAGTVYVQRADFAGGQVQTHAEVNAMMAEAYRSGLPVLFFPEGTTTSGDEVLPFRRGLFNSVVFDDVPMKVATMLVTLDQPNPGKTVGEHVCFVGDALFAPHMFGCLALRGVHAHIRFGEGYVQGEDRFALAVDSRERVLHLHAHLRAELGQEEPVQVDEAFGAVVR